MYVRTQQHHYTCTTHTLHILYIYMNVLVMASFPVVTASVAGSNIAHTAFI